MTYQPQNINCETGVLFGLDLSINGGDNTLLDISSGAVCIVDWTNVINNVGKSRAQVLNFPGKTGFALLSADTAVFTAMFVTESASAGIAALEQVSEARFDNETRRDKVALGIVLHTNTSGIIETFSDDKQLAYEWSQQLNDIVHIVGVTNDGNRWGASTSGDLTMNRTAGSGARLHFNAVNDPKNPTERDSVAVSGAFFIYTKSLSADLTDSEFTGDFKNTIDPNQFDSDGILSGISTNDFTIQTIFFFPQSSTTSIAYGQSIFNTMTAAEDSITDGSFDDIFRIPMNTVDGAKVTLLIVREGTTDLSSSADAKFLQHRNAIIK